jgi:hypothetical protein
MSFQKLNLCASVQRAFDVFYILRTDTANMVRKDLRSTVHDLIRYEIDEYASHSEKLREVASLISFSYHAYHEVRIHDVKRLPGRYDGERTNVRVVQFLARSVYGSLTTVTITLVEKWYEGGYTPWLLQSVYIEAPEKTYMIGVDQPGNVMISEQMRAVADGLLIVI